MGKDYHMPQASRSSSAVNSNAARRKLWPHRAIIRDCAAALAVFAILAAAIGWTRLPAQTILASDVLAAGANPAQLVRSEPFLASSTAAVNAALPLSKFNSGAFLRPSDRVLTVAILACVFAAIIAFNLWFLRHLGRVYASPRPVAGRRG